MTGLTPTEPAPTGPAATRPWTAGFSAAAGPSTRCWCRRPGRPSLTPATGGGRPPAPFARPSPRPQTRRSSPSPWPARCTASCSPAPPPRQSTTKPRQSTKRVSREAASADDGGPADDGGGALRPAILWLDQRAALEADRYTELPAALTAGLGNRPSAGMAGPILCWLARHEPENVAAARWALPPKDWMRLRMTGEAATDPTDASGTLLYDLERDAWADDLIAALGLPGDKLPPVRGSARPSGTLLPGPAAELGLPPGIAVATGAADTAAALHAAGLAADEAMLTLGSGGQWAMPESEFRPTSRTNLYRAVGDGYYRLAPVQNVGVTLNWVRTLLNASWADLYDAAARPARPGAPSSRPT